MSAVAFWALDEKVATWRTIWPAAELARRGHTVRVYAKDAGVPDPGPETDEDVTYILHVTNRAWRGPRGELFTFLDLARTFAAAGRLIVSLDDDWTQMMELQPDPENPFGKVFHSQLEPLCEVADRLVVATPRLRDVFSAWNPDCVVVENYPPEWVLDIPRAAPFPRILWMGEMYAHGAQDWNPLQPFAADLPPLHLVGAGSRAANVLRGWGVDVTCTEAVLDQRVLYRQMSRGVGAMVPVSDTPFNRGKSWNKPLEFMARGLQVVASAHAEYERLQGLTGTVLVLVDSPEALVAAATDLWEQRPSGADVAEVIRDRGLIMEGAGGDAWEKALT